MHSSDNKPQCSLYIYRLRHEKLKKPPKDRGGPNTYQGLKCFDLDDEPPPMTPPTKHKDKVLDDPFGIQF